MRPPEGRSFRRGKRRLPEKNAGSAALRTAAQINIALTNLTKWRLATPESTGLAHRRVSEAACRTSGQEGRQENGEKPARNPQENWQENWREKKTKAPETGHTLLSKKLPHPR
jgi:hypothetical protein